MAAGILILLCLAVYGPGLASIPVIDRDEARFAQASRQMLESGDWVIPRVQDRPRLNKPPLIYWLQASSAWVMTAGDPSRDAIWMYRLPSALAALGSVLITWRLTRAISGASTAFLAASCLALSPLVAFDAHQARADQLLLFCTTAAMACLWRCWRPAHAGRPVPLRWALAFWLALAAGVLAKGPITPLVAALTIAALSWLRRDWRWTLTLRPGVGLLILAAAVGPWVYAVARQVGFADYLSLVWRESAGRAAGSSEGHFAPPGTHTILLIALLWPASLTTAKAVLESLREGWPRRRPADPALPLLTRAWRALADRRAGKPADAFLLAWALPSWVFFELFGAKLAHYPMPLYPALAILSARAAVAFSARRLQPPRLDALAWSAVGKLLGLGLMAYCIASMLGPTKMPILLGIPAVILGSAVITLASIPAHPAAYELALRRGRWAMLLALLVVFTLGRPLIPGDDSARIMQALRTIPAWDQRPLASTHKQDSMVFHTRGRVERLDEPALPAWLRAHPDGLAILRRRAGPGDPTVPDGVRILVDLRDPAWLNLDSSAPGWLIVEPTP